MDEDNFNYPNYKFKHQQLSHEVKVVNEIDMIVIIFKADTLGIFKIYLSK